VRVKKQTSNDVIYPLKRIGSIPDRVKKILIYKAAFFSGQYYKPA
jgi:hypothetical protein